MSMVFNMVGGGKQEDDGYILINSWVKQGISSEILTSGVGTWGAYPYQNVTLRGGAGRVQHAYIRLGPIDLTKYQQIESYQTTYFVGEGAGTTLTTLFVSQSDDARSFDADSISSIGRNSGAASNVLMTLDVSSLSGEYYIYVGTDSEGSSWTNSRAIYPYTCRLLDADAVAANALAAGE